jgi:TonB family protein
LFRLRSFRVIAFAASLSTTFTSTHGAAQQGPATVGDQAQKPRLTKPPKLVKFVEAPYPESEKAAGEQASVILQIAIGQDGTVTDAKVIQSAGAAFDQAALEAVRGFVFEPAEIDDKPAQIRIQYRYDFVLEVAAPTTAVFSGVVRERGTGKPLAEVTVALDDGRTVTTDVGGRFQFDEVQPGDHTVTLSGDELKGLMTPERFEAGNRVEVIYEVDFAPPPEAAGEDADDLEIVVVAPALVKQTVSTKVDASLAKKVAGTQGDVLKIVENMPGVARAAAGSGQVVVWGAAPQDTRVYVDDVRVPLLYHFGGLRSVVHSDIVRSVELIPGGYAASYGRGLGGLVTVETRDPENEKLHGSVGFDLLDVSASASAPIAENTSFSLAGRRSHLDWALERLTDEDVGEFLPIPQYYDAQARLRQRLSSTSHVELGGLISSDDLERTAFSADPEERKSETRTLDFQRVYLRYVSRSASGEETRATPWVGHDDSTLVARFGSTPTLLENDTTHFGLRVNHRARATSFLSTQAGFDFEASTSRLRRAGSISTPPREGDARVFGQPPSDQMNVNEWKVLQASAAPYVEADFELFEKKVHVMPGMRLGPFFTSTDQRIAADAGDPKVGAYTGELTFEPRLALRYEPHSRVAFKAAWGRYYQQSQAEDLSPVFGNPLLGLENATHYLAGVNVSLSKVLAVEATGFHSRSDDLAVRNPSSAPKEAETLVSAGEGRSFGAQFLIRRELADRVFGWIAYTILRAERKDRPDADWRLFDYDQTHVLTALASYDLGAGWEIGSRFRYSTGYPRTPITGAYFDARTGRYEPVLGPKNSDRIPDFWQLDARVSKRFKIQTTELEIYADVQNVTNRENAEEMVYSQNYAQRRYIQGLPILPVVGAHWEF